MSPLKNLYNCSFFKNCTKFISDLCLYWWNLKWSHHLATARPKWVNTIRIAFLMSRCSSFNVSASKVEPIMEQLTNHSWIGIVTKTVQFPIKHTWCIRLNAINLNTYSFVRSVVLQQKSSRCTLHRHATEVWLKNCKKRTLSSFSWKTTSTPSCTMPGIVTALPGLLNIATSEC